MHFKSSLKKNSGLALWNYIQWIWKRLVDKNIKYVEFEIKKLHVAADVYTLKNERI